MISIDDDEIKHAARLFRCVFEEPDIAFLKATTSRDVHACPGSGKTTLLVAKLAILARQWRWRDRGILVLSHTNVARKEVEHRLANDAAGSRLLDYPHFIGTIQSFVDRFLALPYLRDVGIDGRPVDEPRVDDDFFAVRAWNLFEKRGWTDYKTARAFLKKKHEEGRGVVSTLAYRGASRALAADADLPGPHTDSGKQLRALKDALAANGIFRFADMFAFASASIDRHAFLRPALRQRFPWVFIDEVQDTAEDQEILLDDLFATGCAVQKLGDKNQGIFRGAEDGSNRFKWTTALDLPKSHRLAPRIAAFASRLTAVHPMTLQGNASRRDRAHTIFLFNDETIGRVLPAYGDLLLREWRDGLPTSFVAKAVGFRRSVSSSAKKPGRISDYWAEFPGDLQRDRVPRRRFAEAVHWARRLVQTHGDYHAAHRATFDALAHLVEQQEGTRVTRRDLWERFRNGTLDERAVRASVTGLLRAPVLEEVRWRAAVKEMQTLLVGSVAATAAVKEYVEWEATGASATTGGPSTNIYRHVAGDDTVEIVVSTIHSVKGETHDATLLLETLDREHDVATVLPYLCGEPRKGDLGKREATHMKRVFVAMTRPKELVCVALHQGHAATKQRDALRASGWEIQEL